MTRDEAIIFMSKYQYRVGGSKSRHKARQQQRKFESKLQEVHMDFFNKQAVKKPHRPGIVYVLMSKDARHFKLGYTKQLATRLSQLTAATPFEFSFVGCWRAADNGHAYRTEQKAHKTMRGSHAGLRGFEGCTEWFNVNKRTQNFLLRKFEINLKANVYSPVDNAELVAYGLTADDAKEIERNRSELVQEAQKPEGTEARKRLRQLMTHTYESQTINTCDYSSNVSQRTAGSVIDGVQERGEKSCRPSSKTDRRINSYFSAKHSTPRGVK